MQFIYLHIAVFKMQLKQINNHGTEIIIVLINLFKNNIQATHLCIFDILNRFADQLRTVLFHIIGRKIT